MTAVTRRADARRSASIISRSSMMWWSTGEHVDCTTKTSTPRTFSSIRTRVSSFLKVETSAPPSRMPRCEAISRASAGFADPEKTSISFFMPGPSTSGSWPKATVSAPTSCPTTARAVAAMGTVSFPSRRIDRRAPAWPHHAAAVSRTSVSAPLL
jgi:hypothetical protein